MSSIKVRVLVNQQINVPWCNGSTTDFGSVGQGSSPCGTTILWFYLIVLKQRCETQERIPTKVQWDGEHCKAHKRRTWRLWKTVAEVFSREKSFMV